MNYPCLLAACGGGSRELCSLVTERSVVCKIGDLCESENVRVFEDYTQKIHKQRPILQERLATATQPTAEA